MSRIEKELKKRFAEQKLSQGNFDAEGLWAAVETELDAEKPGGGKKRWIFPLVALLLIAGCGQLMFLQKDKLFFSEAASSQQQRTEFSPSKNDSDFQKQKQEKAPTNDAQVQDGQVESTSAEDRSFAQTAMQNDTNKSQVAESEREEKTEGAQISKEAKEAIAEAQRSAISETIQEINPSQTLNNNTGSKESVRLAQENLGSQSRRTIIESAEKVNANPSKEADSSSEQIIYPSVKNQELLEPRLKDIALENQEVVSTSRAGSVLQTYSSNRAESSTLSTPSEERSKAGKTAPEIALLAKITAAFLPSLEAENTAYSDLVTKETRAQQSAGPYIPRKPRIQIELGLFAGTNNTRFKFAATSDGRSEEKNATENPYWGSNYGLQARLLFKQQFLLSTGLELDQMWTRFDYVKEEEFPFVMEDILIKVYRDANTGEVLKEIYGDTTLTATSTRTVRHYNLYRQLNAPLQIGWQFSKDRLKYGATVGANFRFKIKEEGRTLDSDGEVSYFGAGTGFDILPSTQIGWRISPFVQYSISEQLTFNFQPYWSSQQLRAFDETDIAVRAHSFGLQFGLFWKAGRSW